MRISKEPHSQSQNQGTLNPEKQSSCWPAPVALDVRTAGEKLYRLWIVWFCRNRCVV